MPWLYRIRHEIPRRELVFRQRLHHRGVVLVRVDGITNERKGRIVAQAIGEHQAQLAGAFTVIQHATIRIRGA